MKFNKGHWMVKPFIKPLYAAECFRVRRVVDAVEMLVPCQRVNGRQDTMGPALMVRLDAPMEGVIRVEIVHHAGEPVKKPEFALFRKPVVPVIEEDDERLSFRSGFLEARVSKKKGGWGIEYRYDGRFLTASGHRAMAHFIDEKAGTGYTQEALNLSVGECVYGLGERFTPFVKNGQVVESWNEDGGANSELAYKNVPFYLTSRGYGVFVDEPGDVAFEVGSENVGRVQFALPGERLSYMVVGGEDPKDALQRYVALTGKPALPPAWSMGLWLSTSFTTDYDEKTVLSFVEGMKARDIPLSVFHFDCCWMRPFRWCDFEWDGAVFPDPERVTRALHDRGLKVCVWINPYIAQDSPLFREGMESGYLVKKTDGSVWQTDLWQAGMGLVDFTNPGAWKWYQDKLRVLLRQGVDCFKTDFGERIPVRDIAWHDGGDPVRMHNYYTLLYNRCVFSLLEEERGEGEAVVFARSASAGGQQMPVHWGGDNFATYESMAETLRSGLSLAASGFGFWSHDISGFEDTAPADVYKRWCAFGLLSSHSRLHGSRSYRVPWLFDDEAVDVLRFFTRLKCRLMPYLYQKAAEAHEAGVPMLRPMFLEFPDDPACHQLDRQYMLGDALLVAPVFSADGVVDYYLPDGVWTNLLDGSVREGGRWYRDRCDFFQLPLWVRENTLLPVSSVEDTPDYDYSAGLTLRAYHIGKGASIEIPGASGKTVARAAARREAGDVAVEASPGLEYTLEVIG